MSIIYSYPEQTALNDNDTLLGTSAALVGGKKKNITRIRIKKNRNRNENIVKNRNIIRFSHQ